MSKQSCVRMKRVLLTCQFPERLAICFWVVLFLIGGHSVCGGEQFQLAGDWWKQPAVKTRHTCFMATFDSVTSNNADYARGDNRSGGFGMNSDVDGKYGKATCINLLGGHLHFNAKSNFDADKGTIRMLVKGDIWNSDKECWLFESRAEYDRIGIVYGNDELSLVIHGQYRRQLGRVNLSLGKVSADEWHWIVASWDRSKQTGWISLDDKGRSGDLKFPPLQNPVLLFYIGGAYQARHYGRNEPGLCFDEVVIYDASLPELQSKSKPISPVDEELLPKVEEGARKCLNFLADLQYFGGWASGYTWPTMIIGSGRRQFVKFDGAVWTENNVTPLIAARYIYAYNIMGDYRFLQVIRNTGELFVEVQDPWGSWRPGYTMTASGMVPQKYRINIQEVQRSPNFLLAYLYNTTSDKRFLEGIKKSGEFHLNSQNPNGSWSHHWNPEAKRCETYRFKPHGGELNDGCTYDCIDTLILCYHMTSDKRYVDALKRVGQWLLDAQLDGPMYGWADCYDKDNNPEWAREFEPPAYGGRATCEAAKALVEIYRLSGDDKYLKPIRKCLAWLKKDYPDGTYFYHDYKTGRPIASWQYKIVHLDEQDGHDWIRKQSLSKGYYSKYNVIPNLESILANAEPPTNRIPKVTIEDVRSNLPKLRQAASRALAEQNKHGFWLAKSFTSSYDVGASFTTRMPRVLDLLQYIEAVKMLKDELPLKYNGDGSQTGPLAWPKDDWYDVGW